MKWINTDERNELNEYGWEEWNEWMNMDEKDECIVKKMTCKGWNFLQEFLSEFIFLPLGKYWCSLEQI